MDNEKNINSAYRLHKIFTLARQQILNTQALKGWAELFKIGIEDKIDLYKTIIEKISLMDQEFQSIMRGMENTPLKKERYHLSIGKLYSVIAPDYLYHNWSEIRDKIVENDLNILLICSELLRDEEDLISEDDFTKISIELNELKSFLENENIDDTLKTFVQDQIEIIENSFVNYKIVGVKAFKTSYYSANTIIIRDKDILANEDGKKVFNSLKKVWTIILNTSDKVSKITNLISNSEKLIEIGSKIFNNI